MSKVYVVQMPQRWDREVNQLVPDKDVSSAAQYGELVYLLTPKAAPFNPQPVIRELHEKLRGYTPEDYLLLIGNPALIGFAVAIAADYADGEVRLLQWGSGRYTPIQADLLFTEYDVPEDLPSSACSG